MPDWGPHPLRRGARRDSTRSRHPHHPCVPMGDGSLSLRQGLGGCGLAGKGTQDGVRIGSRCEIYLPAMTRLVTPSVSLRNPSFSHQPKLLRYPFKCLSETSSDFDFNTHNIPSLHPYTPLDLSHSPLISGRRHCAKLVRGT